MVERQQQSPPLPERTPHRRETELDREPGSNRGHRGQMRQSRKVARSGEEDVLDPDAIPASAREGRDLRSIGPSDSSDSGSDLLGPGLIDEDLLGLDRGTTEDSEGGHLSASDAGASLGDLGADENSDRNGTGEHLTAGKEPDVRIGADIAPDRIVGPEEAGLGTGLDEAEEALLEDMLKRGR